MRNGLFFLLLLGGAGAALGQDYGTIYKCVDTKGHVTYQNAPCPSSHRIDAVKPYIDVYSHDPAAVARLRSIQAEMDRRNRSATGVYYPSSSPRIFDAKRCQNAKARRERVIQQEGPHLRRDTLIQLNHEVSSACAGA